MDRKVIIAINCQLGLIGHKFLQNLPCNAAAQDKKFLTEGLLVEAMVAYLVRCAQKDKDNRGVSVSADVNPVDG
mgnify:CR=1 FL=1